MEWISVKDGMPEDCVPVIATYISVIDGNPCIGLYTLREGFWYDWNGTVIHSINGEPYITAEVTHWMPAPKPAGRDTA